MLPNATTFDALGGVKQDYSAQTDPTTDRQASEVNQAFADVAAMTRTATRGYLQFTGATSSSILPNFHNAVWGVTVAPIIERTDTGTLTITFPETVSDPTGGDDISVNLKAAWGSCEGDVFGAVNVTRATVNTLTVHLFDSTLLASDLEGFLINIFFV